MKGSSKHVISENIRTLMREGKYKQDQAVAIAYSEARRSGDKKPPAQKGVRDDETHDA